MLGPNAAGKTTAVRVLTTLSRPDQGSTRVAGHDVGASRRRQLHAVRDRRAARAQPDDFGGRHRRRAQLCRPV
ncbi:MAG: ATP-binding cassette domain-containing protein [Solirubrobacteraceae bacterium]